ncbi:30S ribosomal protein S16 [Mycobacterium talmoniae]|uniref:30S ribosomal protein S16 n=1 Tax=Mycobacterium talmoniae TaxID=1858794 RepID=A0A2S8BKI6_9MYCO|nr:30S ribosomal protein S16 [Mycobacterium talmoniae]
MKVKPPKPSKLELFNAALAEAEGGPTTEAATPKKKKAPAKKADKAEAKAEDAEAKPAEGGEQAETES